MTQVVVHLAGGRGYVWNASDVKVLRETRRFIGALVGPNTGTTHQEHLPHSLPLLLMPEELQLGLKRGWFLIAPEPLPSAVLSQAPAQLPSPEDLDRFFKDEESRNAGEKVQSELNGKMPHAGGPGKDPSGSKSNLETAAKVSNGAFSAGERERSGNGNGTEGGEESVSSTQHQQSLEPAVGAVGSTEAVLEREGTTESSKSTEPTESTGVGLSKERTEEQTEVAVGAGTTEPTKRTERADPTEAVLSREGTKEQTEVAVDEGTMDSPDPTEAVSNRGGTEEPTKARPFRERTADPTEAATEATTEAVSVSRILNVHENGPKEFDGLQNSGEVSDVQGDGTAVLDVLRNGSADSDAQGNGAAVSYALSDKPPAVPGAASQGTKKKGNREEEYWLSFADASQRNVLTKQSDAADEATPGFPAPPEEESDRFVVFEDMYNRGYTITSGTNFGGNFLAYAGDPSDYHSEFVVRVVPDASRIPYASLSAASRVALTARKKYLIALVIREADARKIQYVVIAPDLVTASGVNRGLKVLPWLQRKKA